MQEARQIPMRKIIYILTLLIGMITISNAQDLNKYDEKGKKHGKWKVYLDKYWKVLDDSSKAVYYRYTFYDHGENQHQMGRGDHRMVASIDTSTQKGIKILDGEYHWYDSRGNLRYIHILKNGVYMYYKEYYSSGELVKLFDYTRGAKGFPWSWYMMVFDKQGKITLQGYSIPRGFMTKNK
jgi:hypothetical protein